MLTVSLSKVLLLRSCETLADPGMGGPGGRPPSPLAKSRCWVTGKATTDCISPYDKAGLISKV